MIRFALLLTLTACGTRQAPPSTPDAPAVVEPGVASTVVPATLPGGTRTPATPTVDIPPMPSSATAITGLLNAHDTADLPDRSTLDAHDDAVGALVWIANHGSPMAVRGRAMKLLGQYDDELAVQTQRDATDDMGAHPILVASAIRGMMARGLVDDSTSYASILKREEDTDERIVAAVADAKGAHATELSAAP